MKKTVFLTLIFIAIIILHSNVALANDIIQPPIDDVTGVGRFINPPYRDNYYLDIRETRFLDVTSAPINGIANILFSFMIFVARATIGAFGWAMSFELSSVLGSLIDDVQYALMTGIFDSLFIVTVAFFGFQLMRKFIQRNFTSILVEIGQVIFIVVLSILLVTNTSAILTYATNITRSIGISVANGMNDAGDAESFAQASSIMIWDNLIHQLYIFLQTDGSPLEASRAESLLSYLPGSSERESAVAALVDEYDTAFAVNLGGRRIGFLLFYLIPFVAKCAIYLFLSLVQIAFQAMAVFYILLAPLVLVLSVTKLFGGMDLLGVWLKKLLETQLSILILTILLSLIVRLDTALFGLAGSIGFLLTVIIQSVILVCLFVWRNKIFGVFTLSSRSLHNPQQVAGALANSGIAKVNYKQIEDGVVKSVKKTYSGIKGGFSAIKGYTQRKEPISTQQKSQESITTNGSYNQNQTSNNKQSSAPNYNNVKENQPRSSDINRSIMNKNTSNGINYDDKNISADKVNINKLGVGQETAEEKAKNVNIAKEININDKDISSANPNKTNGNIYNITRPTTDMAFEKNTENKKSNLNEGNVYVAENKERVRPSIIDMSNVSRNSELSKRMGGEVNREHVLPKAINDRSQYTDYAKQAAFYGDSTIDIHKEGQNIGTYNQKTYTPNKGLDASSSIMETPSQLNQKTQFENPNTPLNEPITQIATTDAKLDASPATTSNIATYSTNSNIAKPDVSDDISVSNSKTDSKQLAPKNNNKTPLYPHATQEQHMPHISSIISSEDYADSKERKLLNSQDALNTDVPNTIPNPHHQGTTETISQQIENTATINEITKQERLHTTELKTINMQNDSNSLGITPNTQLPNNQYIASGYFGSTKSSEEINSEYSKIPSASLAGSDIKVREIIKQETTHTITQPAEAKPINMQNNASSLNAVPDTKLNILNTPNAPGSHNHNNNEIKDRAEKAYLNYKQNKDIDKSNKEVKSGNESNVSKEDNTSKILSDIEVEQLKEELRSLIYEIKEEDEYVE